jgi:D-aspartate ligase
MHSHLAFANHLPLWIEFVTQRLPVPILLRSFAPAHLLAGWDIRTLFPNVSQLTVAFMSSLSLVFGTSLSSDQPRPTDREEPVAEVAELTSHKRKPGRSIGAVVLGGDYQGLGIVRSLGRKGIPVCVVDDEHSIARYSRYTTASVGIASMRHPEETIQGLLDIGRRLELQGWVLYPTRDETVAAFSQNRDRLGEVFRVPTPGWDSVQWVWDKRNTYRKAEELGIPTPSTWYPSEPAHLTQIAGDGPFAIKPAIKENFIYATKAKAWRADGRAELLEVFDRASVQVPGEVMVQDLIPGGGSQQFAYCAFFKNGEAVGSMVVRRARQHPPEFGRASTYVETIEHPLIEEQSLRFLRAINYYGLVELEYKLDSRDGKYKLLDVNGRTWGYHTLGQAAGVDFPAMLFSDQIGQPVTPCRARPGVKWVRMLTDFPTTAREVFIGNQNLGDYLKSLWECDTEAVFSMDDPWPGIVEVSLLPYLIVKRGF